MGSPTMRKKRLLQKVLIQLDSDCRLVVGTDKQITKDQRSVRL